MNKYCTRRLACAPCVKAPFLAKAAGWRSSIFFRQPRNEQPVPTRRDTQSSTAKNHQVFDNSCVNDAACTEAAYRAVGSSSSGEGVTTVFFEVSGAAPHGSF